MSISEGLLCAGIEVYRDKQQVLTSVEWVLAPGAMTALIGRNGSGKTTLLEALAGIISCNGGTVTFNGEDITGLPPYQRRQRGIVFVPDRGHVFNELTVDEHLSLIARDAGSARSSLIDCFPRFAGKLTQHAGSLSGGEKRILCIHSAVAAKPRLLMVDEFSEGLQKPYVESLLCTIREACAKGACAMLVVHSWDFAHEHGLPVARLESRRIVHEQGIGSSRIRDKTWL